MVIYSCVAVVMEGGHYALLVCCRGDGVGLLVWWCVSSQCLAGWSSVGITS